jgi:outer membrane receptor protein involved in Fe transport
LRGKFGGDWSWDAYYQHGQTRFLNGNFSNDPIKANFNNAVDAVMGPNGTIVCRSTAAQAAGCQPFNVFGTNQGSAAALAYIYGQSVQWITIKQDVAAASSMATLFDLGGQSVGAAGAEYRRESYGATTTALDPTSAFFVGNSHPSSGHYDVKEGFFETVVPLVDGVHFLHHVDFNGAVRYTNYSLSGDVVSWKAGLTWDVDDQLRLRGTRSRDIRAPNLSELFQAGNTQNQTITDPLNGNKSYSVLQYQSGNPTNLKPEKADTTALGVVYRPHWLAGFGMSVDYYDIKVNSAIYTPTSASFVVGQCYTGNAVYCSSIIRDPASNLITNVALQPLNVASESTRGVDFEATYRHHAWSLRAVGTYVAQRRLTVNGATTEFAGSNANFDQSSEAVPHWRLLGTVTWTHGPVIVSATERFIGAGAISERCVVGTCTQVYDVDHNHVPAITYTDLSITLRPQGGAWAKNTEFFFAVQNLLDQAPPVAPIYGPTGFLSTGTNGFLYDLIGRQFRAGARVKF